MDIIKRFLNEKANYNDLSDEETFDHKSYLSAIEKLETHKQSQHIHSLNHYKSIRSSKDTSQKDKEHLDKLINYHHSEINHSIPIPKTKEKHNRYQAHHYHDKDLRDSFSKINKSGKKEIQKDADTPRGSGRNIYREDYLSEAGIGDNGGPSLDGPPAKSWDDWSKEISSKFREHEAEDPRPTKRTRSKGYSTRPS